MKQEERQKLLAHIRNKAKYAETSKGVEIRLSAENWAGDYWLAKGKNKEAAERKLIAWIYPEYKRFLDNEYWSNLK